ncbi:leucyl aminopeptidase family protein [Microbaculum sp. FT89]|uniref:leucyl aminopeptidase family protein n=1 Tax=Microbaculum sp. FT89 TaxID=3447298 RepID=UPI003F5305CB
MIDCLLPVSSSDTAVPIRFVEPDKTDAYLDGLSAAQRAFLEATGYKPKAGRTALLPDADGRLALVLFGLGAKDDADRTPLLPGRLADALPAGTYRFDNAPDDPALAVQAFALGRYRFTAYRGGDSKENNGSDVRLILPADVDEAEIRRIVAGVSLARDLINTPANDMGPEELEEAARQLAETHGASLSVTTGDALLEAGFPMIHAVGRASPRAPRLIDLSWGDPEAPKLTLVGKGVCFDTGGLDIKPAAGMLMMKKDMGGAACVLGLASIVMDANLPVRLRVLVPAAENAVAGNAFRPGDVLESRKGLAVEIGNTDAEGRLVLGDALALADEETPDLIIDMSTLTGAARVALGPDLPAFFSRDDALAAAISDQAQAAHDPVWRLPLWQPYMKMIDGKVGDINNAGNSPFAGAITAALFLSRFVEPSTPWAHFDAYCWNPSNRPGRPEGGEAQAIRGLYGALKARYPG